MHRLVFKTAAGFQRAGGGLCSVDIPRVEDGFALHAVELVAGDRAAPRDPAVLVVGVDLGDGDCVRGPVDVRHDHGVLVLDEANMVADAQAVEIIEFGDGRVGAEKQVADQGGVAEALRVVVVLREVIRYSAVVSVAVVVAVFAVGAGLIGDTEGLSQSFIEEASMP